MPYKWEIQLVMSTIALTISTAIALRDDKETRENVRSIFGLYLPRTTWYSVRPVGVLTGSTQ
jgi:hypothetical protein